MQARAYGPSHVTGFFKIYANGSTGAGFNLEEGMRTRVETGKGGGETVLINGKTDAAPVSRNVIRKFRALTGFRGRVRVGHETRVPIGFGLGMSGAGAYSLALALNQALRAGLDARGVLRQAFDAEIEEGTGLGTVIADQGRGLLLGLPPYPSRKARELKSGWRHAVVGFFHPIRTKSIIRSRQWKEKINEAGERALKKFRREPTAKRFVECARRFTFETGLASRQVERVMEEVPGTSMAMLGETVFGLTSRPAELRQQLQAYTERVLVSGFNRWPARVVK